MNIGWFPDADYATVWLYYCSDDSWTEDGITWNNKPAFDSGPIASKYLEPSGSLAATEEIRTLGTSGNFVVDITDLVKAEEDKIITFVLTLSGSDGTAYSFSKDDIEGRGYNINKLVMCFEGGVPEVPDGLIDFDEMETEYSKVGVELIHAGPEYIEEYDLYTIHAAITNKGQAGYFRILPFVKLLIVMDDEASEYLANHEPQHGYYDYQNVISFGVPGVPISFPITLPQLQVEYSTFYEDGMYKVQWVVSDPTLNQWASGRNVIQKNCYADFAITVKVPAKFKPYVEVMAELTWYIGYPALGGCIFVKDFTEQICWLVVDPPGANPINPVTLTPEPLPESVPSGVDIKNIQVRGCNFIGNPAFEFGSFLWSLSGGASITNTISHNGQASAKLLRGSEISQSLYPCRYGDEVEISCWVYSNCTSQVLAFYAVYTDDSYEYEQYSPCIGWSRFAFQPENHKTIKAIRIYDIEDWGVPIYIDDVDAHKIRNFEKGEYYEVWLDVYWLNDGFPLSICVEIVDASGEKTMMCALLASGWVHGESRCGFGLFVPTWASVGTAEVRVSLWTDWKWEATADQYGWDTAMEFDIVG